MSSLIKLDALGDKTRDWNYEQPTLVRASRYTAKCPTNTESFRAKFYETYPALKKLNMENVVFKGGSIMGLLLGQLPNDLDLFLVGLDSEEAALKRVKELLTNFLSIEKSRVEWQRNNEDKRLERLNHLDQFREKFEIEIKAVRRGAVITLTLKALSVPVQIVLLRYDSLEHCLEDDDLGATAIAFDGTDVWLNEESKFGIENMSIRVNPKKLSNRERLVKYFDKGFDIVLPHLDITKLPTHYQKLSLSDAAQLPGLVFAYNKIKGNKIFVTSFIEKEDEVDVDATDNSYASSGRGSDTTKVEVLAENIHKLCNDQENFSMMAEGDFILNVLNISPGITPRQVNNFYQSFKKRLVVGSNFDFSVAKRYFQLYSVAEVANRLFTAERIGDAADALTEEHVRNCQQKLHEWTQKERAQDQVVIPRRETEASVDSEVFPRLFKEDKDFYGDFFKTE